MSFRWLLRDTPKTTTGSSDAFETLQAAEDWMGAEWRRLLEEGNLAATLMQDDRELYTMKLTAE